MSKVSSPLRWHGGKGAFNGKLAKWLISLMARVEHNRFVDAYFGGGTVLLYKPCEGIAEYANDINGSLSNFWQVLAGDRFSEFVRKVQATPFSQVAFKKAKLKAVVDEVDRAVEFFIQCRQSRQGLMKDFATPTNRIRSGMNEQVSAWLNAVDGLEDVHHRVKRVEIRCQTAMSLVDELDSEKTLFYFDPTYLHSTRSTKTEYGEHEMSEDDHSQLLKRLARIEGYFVLSGYHSELYDSFAASQGWLSYEFQIANNASSSKSKEVKTEVAWTNFIA